MHSLFEAEQFQFISVHACTTCACTLQPIEVHVKISDYVPSMSNLYTSPPPFYKFGDRKIATKTFQFDFLIKSSPRAQFSGRFTEI